MGRCQFVFQRQISSGKDQGGIGAFTCDARFPPIRIGLTPKGPADFELVIACPMVADQCRIGIMAKMQKKTLSAPDEQRSFDKGKIELATLGGVTFGRATLQPGWKWSTCVKPIVNTKSCEASHLQYHISGRLRVRMDDGSEDEFAPGEVSLLPPGHSRGSWTTNRS